MVLDNDKIRVQDPRLAEPGEKLWKDEYDGGKIYTYKSYDDENTYCIFTEEGEWFEDFRKLYLIIPKDKLMDAYQLQERCTDCPLKIHRDDIHKVQNQAVKIEYENQVLHQIVETVEGLTIKQNRSDVDGIVEEGDYIEKVDNFVDYWESPKKYINYRDTKDSMRDRAVSEML